MPRNFGSLSCQQLVESMYPFHRFGKRSGSIGLGYP